MLELMFRSAKLEMGKLIIDIPPEHRGSAMHFVRSIKDKDYQLTIKEHRNKRSKDANAYAWELINMIADALRVSPIVVYKQAIQNVPNNYEIIPVKEIAVQRFKESWEAQGLGWPCIKLGKSKIPGYVNVQAYYGSSTYDSRQFSIMVDHLKQDCDALGIPTRPSEEIESLLRSQK